MNKRAFVLTLCLCLVGAFFCEVDQGRASDTVSASPGYFRDPTKVIEMRKRKITHAQRKAAAARQAAQRARVAKPDTASPPETKGGAK